VPLSGSPLTMPLSILTTHGRLEGESGAETSGRGRQSRCVVVAEQQEGRAAGCKSVKAWSSSSADSETGLWKVLVMTWAGSSGGGAKDGLSALTGTWLKRPGWSSNRGGRHKIARLSTASSGNLASGCCLDMRCGCVGVNPVYAEKSAEGGEEGPVLGTNRTRVGGWQWGPRHGNLNGGGAGKRGDG
jgi:hypothetical protein